MGPFEVPLPGFSEWLVIFGANDPTTESSGYSAGTGKSSVLVVQVLTRSQNSLFGGQMSSSPQHWFVQTDFGALLGPMLDDALARDGSDRCVAGRRSSA